MTDSTAWKVELTVDRDGAAAQRVEVAARSDDTTGRVLDALAVHLGMDDMASAVFGQSLLSSAWFDREAPIAASGLLRGEYLRLSAGLTTPSSEPVRRWDVPGPPPDARGTVVLNRPPRGPLTRIDPDLVVPTQPSRPDRRRFPVGAVVLPLVIAGVLLVIVRQIQMVLFVLLSPLMMLWNQFDDQRTGRRAHRADLKAYEEAVEQTRADADSRVDSWLSVAEDTHPGPDETWRRLRGLDSRLWERRPGNPDFLDVRIGRGAVRAPVTLSDNGTGTLTSDLERRLHRGIGPVTVSLADAEVVALVGASSSVDDVFRWLITQLVTQHSPRDVQIGGILADTLRADWPAWTPHTPESRPGVGFGIDEGRRVVSAMTDTIRARQASSVGARGVRHPAIVFVVDARSGVETSLLTTIMEEGPEVGVSCLWLGLSERSVPGVSTVVVHLEADAANVERISAGRRDEVVAESVSAAELEWVARLLAPLSDATDSDLGRGLPHRILLDELLPRIDSPTVVRGAWESTGGSAGFDRLWAVLGSSADGAYRVDLGPEGTHVLVGGTTGSGKSELLQVMVTSLAAQYSPERVGFLLVDYKGGTAFKDAVQLPHTQGLVTDLDDHLADRVLIALRAEISRREHLLQEAGARSLLELRRLSRRVAVPDLVVVIDEFATLVQEVPGFVDGVVDIAARGRALGIRLVLATQRPAGVVNDRIRANVGVRIALRVLDDADSRDVIDSTSAAAIAESAPGRAYARKGRELVEFQTAFAGAPSSATPDGDDVIVTPLGPIDVRAAGSDSTLLRAVVDATTKVMRLGRWQRPDPPWLPPMPEVVTLADVARELGEDLAPGTVVLGRTDEPRLQRQRVMTLDLDRRQNLLVYGTTRSGKTTVLRTIAAGIIDRSTPAQTQFYVIDCAGHGLSGLVAAPHCGGVVGPDDPGRTARLLRFLRAEVERRQRLLAANGCTTYADLLRTDTDVPARVVVLLDSYAGFVAAFDRVDGGRMPDQLQRLVADGPTTGIHLVLTADRRAAIPGAMSSLVTSRLVLRMAERDDYMLLGVDPAMVKGAVLPPGRGFVQGAVEVQVAICSGEANDRGQLRHLSDLCEKASAGTMARAVPVGPMPAAVVREELDKPTSSLRVGLGIGDERLATWFADLTLDNMLIAGPPRSGRSTTLATLVRGLLEASDPASLALVAPRRSPLYDLQGWAATIEPGEESDIEALVRDQSAHLAEGGSLVVVCDDCDDLSDPVSRALEALVRQGRDLRIRLAVAADSRSALRTYTGVIPEIRKSKQGVLLAPDVDLDGDLLGVRLRAPLESLQIPGRGFAIRAGTSELIQVAR